MDSGWHGIKRVEVSKEGDMKSVGVLRRNSSCSLARKTRGVLERVTLNVGGGFPEDGCLDCFYWLDWVDRLGSMSWATFRLSLGGGI